MTDFHIDRRYACFEGKQLFCSHQSSMLGCKMNFAVYLPPKAEVANCAVLWFLSGLTCTEENFVIKSGMQRFAAEHDLVVISPDTSPRGTGTEGEDDDYALGTGAGFYVDATQPPWSRHYRMYSYIVDELQQMVVQNFPVLADKQAITGFSMGGHGALVLALRQPDLYRSVSALAPICAPSQCPWGVNAYNAYLGNDLEAWAAYDTVQLIGLGRSVDTLYVDQGSDDEFLSTQLHPELLQTACTKAGVDLQLRMLEGYDHSFYFVASVIGDHIALHAERLYQG